jgi:DNA (cytosine-5)-methyltransferase 1
VNAVLTAPAPRIGSLCSGYGHCQYDPDDKFQYAARILEHHWPDVPNHGDITTVDYSKVEPVDILTAGFPCQDVSLAGRRIGLHGDTVVPAGTMVCGNCRWGDHDLTTCEAASPSGAVPSRLTGLAAAAAVSELNARDLADPAGPPPERVIKGTRSGLWKHVARAIEALQPRLVVIENVRGLLSSPAHSDVEPCTWCMGEADTEPPHLRALGAVLGDLARLGFDAEWQVVRASEVGACHQRERVILIAWRATADAPGNPWRFGDGDPGTPADPDDEGTQRAGQAGRPEERHPAGPDREPADPSGAGLEGRREGRPAREGAAPEDPDGTARGERRVAAPGPEEGGGTRGDAGGRGGVPAPRGGEEGTPGSDFPWGDYESAVRRWERVIGRPAPHPVDRRGRLSPLFVEWMMGLDAGHVTAVPGLPRSAQLKALGNGVVPQQAAYGLWILLQRTGLARLFGLAA